MATLCVPSESTDTAPSASSITTFTFSPFPFLMGCVSAFLIRETSSGFSADFSTAMFSIRPERNFMPKKIPTAMQIEKIKSETTMAIAIEFIQASIANICLIGKELWYPTTMKDYHILRHYRRQRQWSMGRLANTSGLSVRLIRKIENVPAYNAKRDTMVRISEALELPVSMIFFPEEAINSRGVLHGIILYCEDAVYRQQNCPLKKPLGLQSSSAHSTDASSHSKQSSLGEGPPPSHAVRVSPKLVGHTG